MADRRDIENLPAPERQGTPGKTPGKAEGGQDERSRPYPNAPGKTPGKSEGEAPSDPGTRRAPSPDRPD
jgi:hypothetical protein